MNTTILRMKNHTSQKVRNSLLVAGLLVLPLVARAQFTSNGQTISIIATHTTSTLNPYAVGNGFNTNTLAISAGGTLTLNAGGNQGLQMGVLAGNINNAITVDGDGSALIHNTGEFKLGMLAGGNSVTVSNGGTMNAGPWGFTIAANAGTGNTLTVTGKGSTFSSANLNMNGGGSNSVSILAGGTSNNGGSLLIGNASAANTYTVGGSNSVANVNGEVLIGTISSTKNDNALIVNTGGTVNVKDAANTAKGIIVQGLSGATGNKVQIDGGTLNVVSAGSSTIALNVKKGALILNSGTVTTERLLANTDATSVVTFNGGSLTTQGTTIANSALFTVGNGSSAASLKLDGGSHSFANGITLANNATLSGTGTITTGTLVVSSGATLSPGNSPGTLNTAAETWLGGGTYVWEINNATGTEGTNWDFINGSGELDLTGLSPSSKFNINLIGLTAGNVSGAVPNWDNTTDQTWKIATFTSIVGTFSAANFNVDATGFTNNNSTAGGRIFGISNVGNDLFVTYAVPEPSTWTLLGLGLTTVMVLRRRRA